ncbi:ABC transporter ATP-binding protein [Aristaeella hokkaidonensis]|jgi:ABC-2 type transport system ATP-binding protein|uniref:ABC transporter ATP-binding protein n=1 Tax=Aristaeella hokkaidonensis TaxID=3046382 RepID=A0AC61N4R1_9FIRM|nr:ABC transporter ATP-binding protein [Aristaeella hokkaidonensis]QTE69796.1 ABC transporter ATP-binding protein [Clostridiales bacterium FE2011]QUC66616.1 ABC transporter ATP-binding protein [Aristaeella hokkaidonensis]SNT95207.1 ABC-2 type transport system ATP-binding protein [Aristaeella hokkaidonensis]
MHNGICVTDLYKKYGNNTVLNNINMTLMPGEIVGLVGTNGAGKSTLLSILCGLKRNYTGNVEIDGVNIRSMRRKKNIGCLIENPGLYPALTGMENIKYFTSFTDTVTTDEIKALVGALELGDFINKKVKKYSLGMKQRLGIAIALLGSPKYLLLDEPMRGVDPEVIPALRKYLVSRAREAGTGIMISSHILGEIESMCDRVIVLQAGRIIESIDLKEDAGSAEEDYIISSSETVQIEAFLREKGYSVRRTENKLMVRTRDTEVNELIKLLVANGLNLTGIAPYRENLEERFIKAIKQEEDQ